MKLKSLRRHLCPGTVCAMLVMSASTHAADVYLLEPGDVVEITVWEEPDLMKELLIRPDGRLSFPLVGEIDAAGHSVEEIGESIATGLEPYITDPAVSVTVVSTNGSRIYVVGRVNRPGVFPLDARLDILHALTLAGGLAEFADFRNIRVIRRTENGQVAIRFNYEEVSRGRELEQNIALRAGDTVVVP